MAMIVIVTCEACESPEWVQSWDWGESPICAHCARPYFTDAEWDDYAHDNAYDPKECKACNGTGVENGRICNECGGYGYWGYSW